MKTGPFRRTPQQDAIFQKVISSNASEDEMKTFREFQNQRVDESLAGGENTLLKIEKTLSPQSGRRRAMVDPIVGWKRPGLR